MTDEMPETVFVTALADEFGPRKAYSHCGSWPSARTEYLRADVAHTRIEAQAALIAELTEALRPFAQEHAWGPDTRFSIYVAESTGELTGADLDRARIALSRAEEAQK